MNSDRWQQIKAVLDTVLELPAQRREAYLHDQYAHDPELQREVVALLEAHDSAETFLEAPAPDYAATLIDTARGGATRTAIGEVLDGFRIVSVLGRGGMGIVYKAEDEELQRTVALKMIDPSLARDEDFVRRFRQEARALARIDSRHIVAVHALRRTEHGLFIVMEYVDGGTVGELLADGPVPFEKALPIIDQMLQAFEAAHSVGIVHRDIKPGNIMLTSEGTVKVTDFGLAKRFEGDDANAETLTKGIAGTLYYMSPEQIQGRRDLDGRSDLFSAGVTIYQMLTGRLPIEKGSGEFAVMRAIVEGDLPPPSSFNSSLTPAIDRFVMKALAKRPAERYPSARAMRKALHAVLETADHGDDTRSQYDPPPILQGRPPEQSSEPAASSRRWLTYGSLGALAVLLIALGAWLWLTREASPVDQLAQTSTDVQPGDQTSTSGQTDDEPGPTTQPEVGTLTLTVSPANARVEVDGRAVSSGETIEVDPGRVTVVAQRNGFRPYRQSFDVAAGDELPVTITLTPLPPPDDTPPQNTDPQPPQTVGLTLTPPAGGSAVVAGQTVRSRGTVQVQPGRQRVTFTHPQHGEWTTTIQVSEPRSITAYFERRVNLISLDGERMVNALLYVNGRERGSLPQQLTWGRGSYRIEAREDGYQVEQREVTVEPSLTEPEPLRIVFQMERL